MFNITRQVIEQGVRSYQIDNSQRFRDLYSKTEVHHLRRAAVMIPMFEMAHQWHILLTQRADTLLEHRGQVAFPGGAQEAQDTSLQDTALREMQEEIGIKPGDVEVFGHLGDMPIITGYLVRPFVGQIPWPYPLSIAADEVQSAFHVPLKWLADPKNRTTEYRSYAGREFPVIFFNQFDGYQLWGASAEMTMALLGSLKLTHA